MPATLGSATCPKPRGSQGAIPGIRPGQCEATLKAVWDTVASPTTEEAVITRRALLRTIAAAGATAAASTKLVTAAGAAESLPAAVPSVQLATPGSGTGFTWTGSGRIVVDDRPSSRLKADARTFASDLAEVLGAPVPPVVHGAPSTARPGDITLSLGNTDSRLGTEGYGMTIAPVLAISAPTATGAFWGTRTVLQLLRQQRTLPPTTIADWPRFKVRAISVSVENFPVGWFLNLVRDMSYVKLNEVTTMASLTGLTDAEIRQIRQVADQYHVKFVGWFNTTHYNSNVPADYQLRVIDRRDPPHQIISDPTTLDITEPAALRWATKQIKHYMRLQTAPLWHAGGDEYPKFFHRVDKVEADTAPDLYAVAKAKYPTETFPVAALYNEVFNQINDLAKSHGKQLRIWNDCLVPTTAMKLDTDVVVDHWIIRPPAYTPAQLAAAGHHLINSNMDYLYFRENDEGGINTTDEILWSSFDPSVFHGNVTLPPGPGGTDSPQHDGIKLCHWHGARHKPPGPLEVDLLALSRPLAERAWRTTEPTTTIEAARTLFAQIGRAPGVVPTPLVIEG
jgi:Glycosyl hydrolase family 20, domain 2/Glycosyl hydrolase family 20, catalytic domain